MPAKPLTPEQRADAERLAFQFSKWQTEQLKRGEPATQAHAAARLGFGQSALSQYLRGAIPLNLRVLSLVSKLFGCDPAEISPSLTASFSPLERAARQLQGQTARNLRLSSLKLGEFREGEFPEKEQGVAGHQGAAPTELFPVVSWATAAEWHLNAAEIIEESFGDVWLPSPIPVAKSSFYLRITSESMLDRTDPKSFQDGDLILVDPSAPPSSGCYVVIALPGENEAFLRQLIIEAGRQFLKALNPAWPDRISPLDPDGIVCGVVKGKVVYY